MTLRLAAIILAATVVSARAEPPVRPSPVRQALIEALGPGAAVTGNEPSFPSIIEAMPPEARIDARIRLDALDREVLSEEALTDLSRVYTLLGAHDPATQAGLALQSRNPKGTQGLVLAASAKLEEKDYASSVTLAEQALKINPKDLDAQSVLQSAKGRVAPTSPARFESASVSSPRSEAPAVVDDRPLKQGMRARPGEAPPVPIKDDPASPSPGGAPWLPYVIGGALTIYGVGRGIKHTLERGKGAIEQTVEKADDGIGDLYFKGKEIAQEHPNATIAVGLTAVAVAGWFVLPALGLGIGGGGTMMLATAGGGNVAVAASANGVALGAMKVTAVAAAATAPLLMSGDAEGKNVQSAPKQSSSAPESRIKIKEKPTASDSELQRAINKLFQPGDTVPGGTAGAAEKEFSTKLPTSTKFHLQASKDRLTWLERIAKSRPLSAQDQLTVEMLMNDLRMAIRLYTPTP